jgi:hypothetical protein
MHKRKPDFDPLKFTPSHIHNKIEIPIQELVEYFKSHTLKECASKFNCSSITIKRKLRAVGVDTSIHNHSELAKKKYRQAIKQVPNDQKIKRLYIDQNLDAKTIAELYGLHYQTIRKRTSRYKKSREMVQQSMMNRHFRKYGVCHPSQRPDVLKKTSISLNKAKYRNNYFKSLSELAYALFLDNQHKEWYYEEMRIPYVDMMTGKRRIYVIDFTVCGEEVEWIEVKPNNQMIPDDKRIYASRRAEEAGVTYRGLTEEERVKSWELMVKGFNFDQIEFLHRKPRLSQTKITYYFKDKKEATKFKMRGWKQFAKPSNDGVLWKKILIRK